jgi:hypothetical protein
VLPYGIKHHRKNGNEDDGTDDQHHPVQPLLLFGDFGGSRMQIELVDRRAAWQVIDSVGCRSHPSACENARAG